MRGKLFDEDDILLLLLLLVLSLMLLLLSLLFLFVLARLLDVSFAVVEAFCMNGEILKLGSDPTISCLVADKPFASMFEVPLVFVIGDGLNDFVSVFKPIRIVFAHSSNDTLVLLRMIL